MALEYYDGSAWRQAATTVSVDTVSATYFNLKQAAFVYFAGNMVTNTLTANVFQKINGGTNTVNTSIFGIGGASNKMQLISGGINVICYATVNYTSSSTTTHNMTLQLVKNGTLGLITPTFPARCPGSNVPANITLQTAPISLNVNDYVELYVSSTVNTTFTAQNMIWTLQPVF